MAWTPLTHRSVPWIRLWLACIVVAGCALGGLMSRCGDMIGTGFAAVLLMIVVLVPTALGSLVASLLACVRRDWRCARLEAGVGVLMLLTVPLAFWAMVSLSPDCPCQDDGC